MKCTPLFILPPEFSKLFKVPLFYMLSISVYLLNKFLEMSLNY